MDNWFGFLCSACSSQPKDFENGGPGVKEPSKSRGMESRPARKQQWFGEADSNGNAANTSDIPTLAGVGVVFRAAKNGDGDLCVVAVAPDGPAKESGKVFSGQKLIEIAGTKVAGLDNSDIAALILGPPGLQVELVLQNENGEELTVNLTRKVRNVDEKLGEKKAFHAPQ